MMHETKPDFFDIRKFLSPELLQSIAGFAHHANFRIVLDDADAWLGVHAPSLPAAMPPSSAPMWRLQNATKPAWVANSRQSAKTIFVHHN